MSSRIFRRSGAAALGASLLAAGLTAVAPASVAHGVTDPAPAQRGAAWLESQLTDGLIVGPFGTDYGNSAELALALDAVGGHDQTVDTVAAALGDEIASYVRFDYFDDGDGDGEYDEQFTGTSAGSTGKAAVLAQVAGLDPTDYGNENLIATLAERVSDDAATLGRAEDSTLMDGQPSPRDFVNSFGQAFVARALLTAEHAEADEALGYLLDQQCSAGFFRLYFPAKTGDQTCDGASPAAEVPPVDATAFVVTQLHGLAAGDATLTAALDKAVAWIAEQQAANGSFDGGTQAEGANANSTGLAARALELGGEHEAAERAATWVRGRQVTGTRCDGKLSSEEGAIAYDPATYTQGVATGITADDAYVWQFSTIQALPGLLSAPASTADLDFGGLPNFLDGGSTESLTISGLAPGERACARIGSGSAAAVGRTDGTAVAKVKVPNRTGFVPVSVESLREAVGTEAVALAAKTLPLELKTKVARGDTQRVVVDGLFNGEKVVVKYDGQVVARGKAAKGSFVATFPVGRKTGAHRVQVLGQFADRTATKSFKVG